MGVNSPLNLKGLPPTHQSLGYLTPLEYIEKSNTNRKNEKNI